MFMMIRKQFRVQWQDWMVMVAFEAGAFLIGFILFGIIMGFSDENTYFAMGTVMAAMMALIFSVIQSLSSIQIYFNMEISMGVTRKKFFWSYLIAGCCANLISVLLVILLNVLENSLLRMMYAGLTEEINFLPYLIRWAIPVSILLTVYGGFCGTLVMRFGRKAFWVLWVIWMIACIGGPQIAKAVTEDPGSLYGRIGSFIGSVISRIPAGTWITAAVIFAVLAFSGMWVIIRKQPVKA